jgi:hypothetical protein
MNQKPRPCGRGLVQVRCEPAYCGCKQVMFPPSVVDDKLDWWLGSSEPVVVQYLADAGRTGSNDAAIKARMATSFMLSLRDHRAAQLRHRRDD